MKKLFAIGTLLLSSAAVFAAPAAAYDRNPYTDHARIEEKARVDARARLERDRREQERREVRYVHTVRDRC